MDKVTILQKLVDFANIFKAFIGCTYLTMPFAFYQSGILLGVIMLLIVGWLNDYCCVQIVKCKDIIVKKLIEQFENKYQSGILPGPEADLFRTGALKKRLEDRITLGHIAKYTFGKKGQWIVTICLLISQFGFCTGYFVFVGNTFWELIYSRIYNTNSTTNKTLMENSLSNKAGSDTFLIYMILIPLPIFILFSLLRTIRNMGWISMLANSAIAFGYFAILGYLIDGFSVSSNYKLVDFKSVAVIFGILTAAFEGIGTVIPIETSMIGNRHNFGKYLHITMFLVICVLGSFGIVGHLRYGSNTKQIILQNLPPNIFVLVINSVLIVSVICTYPLQMFPVVEIAEFLFFRQRSSQFVQDRIQILSTHGINDMKSDFEQIQDEILAELSADESDGEQEYKTRKKIKRKTDNQNSMNYGSTRNDYSLFSNDTIQDSNANIQSNLESVYTKKQLRMIRVIYGSNTVAPAWKRNIIRITIVFLQLGLALLMRNNFAYLSAFIGAIGSSFLCYIFPAATHFKLTRLTEERLYCKIADFIIITFGIVGSISSVIITIYKMVEPA